ncbi:MAG: 5-(carboxyamino)imidazole ribonucleotide synthase [Pseudomonadales bacterium]
MPESVARLGILGAGQLGHLLCAAARKLNVRTILVGAGPDDPVGGSPDETLYASCIDLKILQDLVSRVDVITFEKEAIPVNALEFLIQAEQAGQVAVHPSPRILLMLQNKGLQKRWLSDQAFPTAPFEILAPETANLYPQIERFGLPLVQKALQGGYDGRGVQILRTQQECGNFWTGPSLIEQFVADRRELAVLVARNAQGELRSYAPVELRFDTTRNVLDLAQAPADIDASITREALQLAECVISRLRGIGVFAVEMFLTDDNTLLINEISPRVHNAGHHTMESCLTSQFEQHVRAVCGLPLGATEQSMPAATLNLLCTPLLAPLCETGTRGYPISEAGLFLHWYGKRQARTGRKLGHLTCLDTSTAEAALRAGVAARRLGEFAEGLSP